MTPANFATAADLLDVWRDDVLSGTPPTLYPVGADDLARIEIGPGLVTLLGGAPGAGKTAFTMQLVIDALRLTPSLRAVVCNVEMSPAVLLDRQLARLSGVDLTTIRHRRFDGSHADRLDQAIHTLEALAERLAFVRPPFDLANIAGVADEFGAGLMVLDYIQRIRPPGEHNDKRGAVNATMDYLRQFADAGVALVVLSAVGRTKDEQGRSSYAGSGMSLASFRETSELEFGADDCFILHPERDDAEGNTLRLRHLKSRHGEARDMLLTFDRPRMLFTPLSADEATEHFSKPHKRGTRKANSAKAGKIQSALATLWSQTPAADDADTEGADA
jgi:replicative DNA helicase